MIFRLKEEELSYEKNPITGLPYDDSWILFLLTDSPAYHIMNGRTGASVYSLKVSKSYPHWEFSVMDFLQFQEAQGKNILLSISDEAFENAKAAYQGHSYQEKQLRSYEPEVLIHSTTLDCWKEIQRDGALKSWNLLRQEKSRWEASPIGAALGDPPDFSDYIMLSNGSISGEIVVLSKQNHKIIMDQDKRYTPGARLYFNAKKIAQDGLLVRDGCHYKVLHTLPLQPYLLWVGDRRSVGLETADSTPKEFTERSNETFRKLFQRSFFW